MFLLYQFIRKSLPDEVVEAAVLAFADGWNMVEQPMILLRDEWRYPLSLVLSNHSGSLSVSFAGAVLYVLPMVLVYFAVEDELIQGVFRMGV